MEVFLKELEDCVALSGMQVGRLCNREPAVDLPSARGGPSVWSEFRQSLLSTSCPPIGPSNSLPSHWSDLSGCGRLLFFAL